MNAALFLLAFCVGIFISVQAAVNSQLAGALHANSVVAALISFSVGTLVLLRHGHGTGRADLGHGLRPDGRCGDGRCGHRSSCA